MSLDDKPAPLGEEEIREAVNRWNDKRYFRIKNLGDKIFLGDVVSVFAFTVRLETHYERRALKRMAEPYHGGPVDQRSTPPRPWDMPVRRPGPFQERTEKVPVPHTERVTTCSSCTGVGKVDCPRCRGRGRVSCPWCGGSGYRERTEMQPGRDPLGNVAAQPVTVRERCSCGNGTVGCNGCAGNGRVVCDDCEGSGQVKTFTLLTVRFHCERQGQVLDPTDVPDELFYKLSGEAAVDEEKLRIEDPPPVTPEVDRATRALLQESQAVNEDEARVLLQRLHVEKVPVHEVRYTYAGKEHRLWVCGKERAVHAAGAPWRSGQMILVVGGAVGLVLLAIILLAALRS